MKKTSEKHKLSESQKTNLSRFIKLRDELMSKHHFADSSEFERALGVTEEGLRDLCEKHEVLFVEIDSETLYPVFQLDERLRVFDALKRWLPRLYRSRSGWDIVLWLNDSRTVLMKKVDAQPGAANLDEVIEAGIQATKQSIFLTETPLNLLKKEDVSAFNVFIEDSLNPDYREIPRK